MANVIWYDSSCESYLRSNHQAIMINRRTLPHVLVMHFLRYTFVKERAIVQSSQSKRLARKSKMLIESPTVWDKHLGLCIASIVFAAAPRTKSFISTSSFYQPIFSHMSHLLPVMIAFTNLKLYEFLAPAFKYCFKRSSCIADIDCLCCCTRNLYFYPCHCLISTPSSIGASCCKQPISYYSGCSVAPPVAQWGRRLRVIRYQV